MAEFCLECHNKPTGDDLLECEVALDRNLDLCEGCGCYKHTIMAIKVDKNLTPLKYKIYTLFVDREKRREKEKVRREKRRQKLEMREQKARLKALRRSRRG